MKIAILGGSFNPIHNGHLIIARYVYHKLKPSKFFFVPTYIHPLKDDIPFLSYEKRCYLIKKALENYKEFELSYMDKTKENRPSYTDELIKRFKKKYPEASFYFIVGEDILNEFKLWHNYRWLQDNLNFIVISRSVSKSPTEDYPNFIYFQMPPVDISSTDIREKIKKGEPITDLVPPSIEMEIIKYYLPILRK